MADNGSRDLLEIYCFLVCMGPDWLQPEKALSWVRTRNKPEYERLVQDMLDTNRRPEVSRELGCLLAEAFAGKGRNAPGALASLLPALLEADIAADFSVLRHMAAAASPELAETLASAVLSMLVAENDARVSGARSHANAVSRMKYLITVLAKLNLPGPTRTKIFLGLTQTLEIGETLRDVVLSPLFPADKCEGPEVLLRGGEKALRAIIAGAASRPAGKSEFYNICRALMDLGLGQGLRILSHIYGLLDLSESAHRALASMVRASVLLSIEQAILSGTPLRRLLPDDPDLQTLNLLAVVSAGIVQPARTEICEYLIEGVGKHLKSLQFSQEDCRLIVQVLISATVLHRDAAWAGSEVRRILLETAGSLHVRAQVQRKQPDTAPFASIVRMVSSEFRRRDALASCLSPVLPLLVDFTPREGSGEVVAGVP